MLDLVIKHGKIIAGTGAPQFTGDIAIAGGTIVVVGKVTEAACETINSDGLTVMPGFVDVHTHYDTQVYQSSVALCNT